MIVINKHEGKITKLKKDHQLMTLMLKLIVKTDCNIIWNTNVWI